MRINLKQKQLVDELLSKVQKNYPEIVFKHLENSPDDPEHIWIIVDADMDEEREIEMCSYSASLQIEILLDFGYQISIMADNPNTVYA